VGARSRHPAADLELDFPGVRLVDTLARAVAEVLSGAIFSVLFRSTSSRLEGRDSMEVMRQRRILNQSLGHRPRLI
jgi:hypothetical protein